LFTAGSWSGHIVVWGLAKNAWVGGVSLEVTDSTQETSVAGSNYAEQLNRRICSQIGMVVRKALDQGTSQKGKWGSRWESRRPK